MARSFVSEARRRVGPKRDRILPIIQRLAAAHPDATIALRFRSDLELLVSVMLSAQTTDVNVNRVTETLFRKYKRPEDYLAVPVEELQNDIRATGFFRQKTKSLRGTMKMLIEEFDGEVPRTLEELTRLPGVARKTANVVASELGETQGVVVDTHVRRLSQRLGLTRQDDPVKIERDLQRLVPREYWGVFPHLLIWHGRRVCLARRPRCEECVLSDALSVYARRASATIRPPSSSYAGKKSAVTGWVSPLRVRSSSFSSSRRTPHSRVSCDGFLPSSQPESENASMTSLPRTSFSW